MILLIDSGNTRVKWRLVDLSGCVLERTSTLTVPQPFEPLRLHAGNIDRILVSTVGSEQSRNSLEQALAGLTRVPVQFYWAEATRAGLQNSYQDVAKMGADRWHGMVAAWLVHRRSFAVVDAGSAVTVDYVNGEGKHLGGYILPGLQMMRRSLKLDAARIGFEYDEQIDATPGRSTGQCANHGLAWLTEGLVNKLHADSQRLGLSQILVTGGDAGRFLTLGLNAVHCPGLVLDGLEHIEKMESRG
ncbi:type III pantothenate kinase [Marinobacter halophilus]|uniref:Type III pantothenate kinase n=1 Tax=Marinobacter halophilus TaxID=1323740 RepID=A0A2T1KI09_9GAMM|nr:type III pantothenate kinase [Marinobacter halophilus]PSF09222.1 type III pantothenate kinase [Marinobacter halophilus]GGC84049.1 type III pantothenate kinase [Marinobacter halophilus]